MPQSYVVETSKGPFRVKLQEIPSSAEELNAMAREQIELGKAEPLGTPFRVSAKTVAQRMARGVEQEQQPGLSGFALDIGKQSALPTLLTAGGLAAGGAVGGPPGAVLGEVVGGITGEGLNQLLGITEPSKVQLALSGAAGPVGRGISTGGRALGRAVLRRLPGASATLQELAAQALRELPKRFSPIRAADELFGLIKRIQPGLRIETPNLKAVTNKLFKQEQILSPGLRSPSVKEVSGGLIEQMGQQKQGKLAQLAKLEQAQVSPIVGPSGEQIVSPLIEAEMANLRSSLAKIMDSLTVEQLDLSLRRIGQRTGAVQGLEVNELRAAFKNIYRALQKDLDDAIVKGSVSGDAAALLKGVREAFRREAAILDLEDLINTKAIVKREGDLLESVRPKEFLKIFQSNKFRVARESFSKAEQQEIISSVKALKGLPVLPRRKGTDVGSGVFLGTSGMVSGPLLVAGVDPQVAAGIGLSAAGLRLVLARTLASDTGRKLLRRLITPTKGFLDRHGAAVLTAFVRSQFAQET